MRLVAIAIVALFGCTSDNVRAIPEFMGPKGDKGDIGETGPQGIQGLQGEVGPQGPQGERGPVGEKGDKGDKGDIGPIGPQGAQGPSGWQGPIGPAGPQGAVGAPGPAGAKGADGARGPQGPKGDTGAAGPVGPQGPKGDSGQSGFFGNSSVYRTSVNFTQTTYNEITKRATFCMNGSCSYECEWVNNDFTSPTLRKTVFAAVPNFTMQMLDDALVKVYTRIPNMTDWSEQTILPAFGPTVIQNNGTCGSRSRGNNMMIYYDVNTYGYVFGITMSGGTSSGVCPGYPFGSGMPFVPSVVKHAFSSGGIYFTVEPQSPCVPSNLFATPAFQLDIKVIVVR